MQELLVEAGLGPAGQRGGISWREFIRHQAKSMIACDFFTVDTISLRRIYVLIFIEISSRRGHLAGMTESPDGVWVTQQARNLSWGLQEREHPVRFLLRDRDAKFTRTFDEVFQTEGIEVVRTPVEAPKVNVIVERFVGTLRRECLDWILIADRSHLERVLRIFVDHYTGTVRTGAWVSRRRLARIVVALPPGVSNMEGELVWAASSRSTAPRPDAAGEQVRRTRPRERARTFKASKPPTRGRDPSPGWVGRAVGGFPSWSGRLGRLIWARRIAAPHRHRAAEVDRPKRGSHRRASASGRRDAAKAVAHDPVGPPSGAEGWRRI